MQACSAGQTLIQLPPSCQLTIEGAADQSLLKLVDRVPEELWGAKLALQVTHSQCLRACMSSDGRI